MQSGAHHSSSTAMARPSPGGACSLRCVSCISLLARPCPCPCRVLTMPLSLTDHLSRDVMLVRTPGVTRGVDSLTAPRRLLLLGPRQLESSSTLVRSRCSLGCRLGLGDLVVQLSLWWALRDKHDAQDDGQRLAMA